ncbi:MAG: hypothetical protein O2904_04660 [bacterium]|nr:hypothetical protein [bacterium]
MYLFCDDNFPINGEPTQPPSASESDAPISEGLVAARNLRIAADLSPEEWKITLINWAESFVSVPAEQEVQKVANELNELFSSVYGMDIGPAADAAAVKAIQKMMNDRNIEQRPDEEAVAVLLNTDPPTTVEIIRAVKHALASVLEEALSSS